MPGGSMRWVKMFIHIPCNYYVEIVVRLATLASPTQSLRFFSQYTKASSYFPWLKFNGWDAKAGGQKLGDNHIKSYCYIKYVGTYCIM